MSRGSSQTAPLAQGTVLQGRYRLQRIIGRGRTAIVFAAGDARHAAHAGATPTLAVKILHPGLADDSFEREALAREGELLRTLRHPFIPRLENFGAAGNIPFLAMEMIPGSDLDRRIDPRRPVAAIDIARSLQGAAEALAFLHGQGVVHADVKPGNLRCGANGAARLIDFGSARPAGAVLSPNHGRAEAAPDRIVTPAYASPEAMRGEPPLAADDIYGLAVVAYELAAGRHPFAGRPPLPGEVPIRPEGLGPSGWSWLKDALAADRRDRPGDSRGLAAALLADFPVVRMLRRFSPWRG